MQLAKQMDEIRSRQGGHMLLSILLNLPKLVLQNKCAGQTVSVDDTSDDIVLII